MTSSGKKEFTLTALVLGVVLAVVFGAANAYLGLRVGLTVSASVPAAVISMGVLRFVLRRDSILENNMVQTIGSDAISAPQATLMKVIVEGMMDGGLPWGLLAIGAGLAALLALFRVPVMPVAIGLYLPVGLGVTMFVGGMVRLAVERMRGAAPADGGDTGTLFSAGLVAGEGLCGIVLALLSLL